MYISNINSASIKLQDIDSESIPADQHTTIAADDDLVVLYINKGAANCHYLDKTQEIKKRDLVIINPKHEIDILPIRRLELIRFSLSRIIFTSSLDLTSKDNLFIISDESATLKKYLDLALIENEQRFRGTDLILRKLLECVMVHILRHEELSIKDSDIQTKHTEVERVKQYLKENYDKKVTLAELSEVVDINKYYLIRLFKQQTGLSPIDYLIHIRLEEAEKLLTQTTVPVADISDRVGFNSPSHFSKTFKKNNNCTPSTFRRRAQYQTNS